MRIFSPHHQVKKHPTTPQYKWRQELSGSAQSLVVPLACLLFLVGGVYLYSVNKSAVQNYQVLSLERTLQELKKENAELHVQATEAGSLLRVEEGSQNLRMEKVSVDGASHGTPSVALR